MKYFHLIKNNNINFNTSINRQYNSQQFRQVDVVGIPPSTLYKRNYLFNYQYEFKRGGQFIPYRYHKVILVEAAVLSGNNYTWIKERLLDRGYENDDIITIALTEMNTSIFKCDYVQAYTDTIPEFYWERYNKHWD